MNVKLKKPIFVVGHPRSGTTLLATVLGRNSDLAMPPETQMLIEQKHLLRGKLTEDDMARILANKRVADLALHSVDVLRHFAETDSSLKEAFTTILDRYRAQKGKSRVGEKSPMHLEHAETLLDWFPDAKIICIERNGADVLASMMRMPWSHRNFAKHVFAWVSAASLARDLERRFSHSFRLVSFERFTSAPEKEIRAICGFCDLPFESGMLTDGDASTVPEWESSWKGKASRPIEVQPSNGLEQFTPRQRAQLGTFANRALKRSGYPTVPLSFLQRLLAWLTCWPYHPLVYPTLKKVKATMRG